MAKSGSSTVQYNLENVLKQTMRLQKGKKKKSAANLQFKASKWLKSPLCFFVFPLSFKFLSLRYVDDSDFFLRHALNCKLWKHEKKDPMQNSCNTTSHVPSVGILLFLFLTLFTLKFFVS